MIDLHMEREADGGIRTKMQANGQTNDLLDELAAGAAHVLTAIVRDLGAKDDIYEATCRVFCATTERMVNQMAAEAAESWAAEAADKPPEA